MIMCNVIEKADGNTYLEDYRLNATVRYLEGKLSDLSELYIKSTGLGDMLGCIPPNTDVTDMCIVKYGNMYAIGKIN